MNVSRSNLTQIIIIYLGIYCDPKTLFLQYFETRCMDSILLYLWNNRIIRTKTISAVQCDGDPDLGLQNDWDGITRVWSTAVTYSCPTGQGFSARGTRTLVGSCNYTQSGPQWDYTNDNPLPQCVGEYCSQHTSG